MTSTNEKAALNISVLQRLVQVFKLRKWVINSDDDGAYPYDDVFNDFAELLAYLSSDEQDLVLQLTEDYLHCTTLQYSGLLNQALSKIPTEEFVRCDEIFLIPLKAPKDKGKVKSADGMLYSSRITLPRVQNLAGKTFKHYSDPDLLKKHANRKKSMVLIVDDFIGTGDTAEAALKDYNLRLRVDDDLPIVVALVAQEQGIQKLSKLGFEVVATIIRKRGITDNTEIVDKPRAIALMKTIEDQLDINSQYSLGYGRTEALVSMIRTPNNTFPIFWWPQMPKERLRNTPFKRDKV